MRSIVRPVRPAPCALVVALLFSSSVIRAQQTSRDTTARDTTGRKSTRLQAVTITTTRAVRDEPRATTNVAPELIRLTPATNAWDLARQTAGIEVHDQGQGPGFASNASIRAFSSDHSTDLALWIDGVPVNEPVNGHAEGYNDWSLMFPEAISDFDVIKGPTSALFGNFALAGVVNVRTLERMRGTEGFLTGGAYGRVEGTVLSGFDHDSSGGVFGLRAMREDGWRPNSGYNLLQGHGRAVRNLSPNATLDAGVELYGAKWDSPGFITADQFERGAFDSVANTTDGGFKRRAQERVSLRMLHGSSIWRSTLYATQSRWELFLTTPPEGGGEEGSGAQTEEQDSRYGLGATSAYSVGFSRGEVTAGVEGRFDHSRYENWQDSARTRVEAQERVTGEQLSGAPFIQARVDASQRLTALREGVIDVEVTFTTDPQLATGSIVPLHDDKGLQPVESVVPILTDRVVREYGARLIRALDANPCAQKYSGKSVERLYFKPFADGEGSNKLGLDGEPYSTVAFFGLARGSDGLIAVGIDGLYRLRGTGEPEFVPLPKFRNVGDYWVSFDLPDAVLVMTNINQRASISGAVPMLVMRP